MDYSRFNLGSAHPTSKNTVALLVNVKFSKPSLLSSAVFKNAERHSKQYNFLLADLFQQITDYAYNDTILTLSLRIPAPRRDIRYTHNVMCVMKGLITILVLNFDFGQF